MRFVRLGLGAFAGLVSALPFDRIGKELNSTEFVSQIKLDNVVQHLQTWEELAYKSPRQNRMIGTQGHNDTLRYILRELLLKSDFYEFEQQPYSVRIQVFADGALNVSGKSIPANPMSNTRNGSFTDAPLVLVHKDGCNSTKDFPASTKGSIALIQRGGCTFATKSAMAGKAGARGLVVYDNTASDTPLEATLGDEDPIEGATIPSLGIRQKDGHWLADQLNGGAELLSDFYAAGAFAQVYSHNIIATSRRGDDDNILMLGAHSDSVAAGPGINDNGSGSAALLEVALQLTKYQLKNKVRFAWWTGEEWGLLGSKHYVRHLPAAEQMKIRLYLNFDMLASGNGKLCTYDGDGSEHGKKGPPGSGEAEKLFEDWFASEGIPLASSEFSGRSDYGPFLTVNVPCGGLDTGAEERKTEEEAKLWGGVAGVEYDPNYHGPGDTLANLSRPFLLANTRAIAHAVATYGRDWAGFPTRSPPVPRVRMARALEPVDITVGHPMDEPRE